MNLEFIEIAGNKSQFPQTAPMFHSGTRNERSNDGDGKSQLLLHEVKGPVRLDLKRLNQYVRKKSEMKIRS